MKKAVLSLSLLFISALSQAQPISVTTSQYTVPELVQNILFGNNSNNCLSGTVSNITWSTGTNFGSVNGIGYFTNTNPNFPINSGVILSTGNVLNAHGPNTSTLADGQWPGDVDLYNSITELGIDPGLNSYNDATVLEFDFQPYVNQFSFDFLFASEEYGTFQCDYTDAFAFFLTDLTAITQPVNIALIPGTNIPVSVTTIRNNANNGSCSSENTGYFGNYNGGANAATAATNFNGETIVMTAQSAVNPLHTYHIKLVIADRNDNAYDSAVFLAGGTFDISIGQLAGTGNYQGITNVIQACPNEEITIQAGTATIPNVTYSWNRNGMPLPAITSSTLTVTQSGDYELVLTSPTGCQISSSTMTIQYQDPFPINDPINLESIDNVFDLTTNSPIILNGGNPADYGISFYTSYEDAHNMANPITNPTSYAGLNDEVIYVALESYLQGCMETKNFILNSSGIPSNDKCGDAVTLPVGGHFNDFPLVANNFGATNDSFNLPSFCDGNYSARDIWYSITVPQSGNLIIETQGNGDLDDTVLEAFSSCNSNVSIGCNNNDYTSDNKTATSNLFSKLVLTGLVPGQNIVLRAFGKNESQGTFKIAAYDTALSTIDFNTSTLSYYPVPVVDYLNISNHYNIKSIEVYNLLGQKVLAKWVDNTETALDMTGLQPSIYLVKAIGENKTETFKIVKN